MGIKMEIDIVYPVSIMVLKIMYIKMVLKVVENVLQLFKYGYYKQYYK